MYIYIYIHLPIFLCGKKRCRELSSSSMPCSNGFFLEIWIAPIVFFGSRGIQHHPT